ncbi:MAG: DUF4129 domain-containing protein [Nitrososphaeria archaeon]|nr:DUF4129 domain-containing protein [Nitrososphaeria archaeon]NIN52341.1 DUF4129 domain-containing protein [Nitrososphaeria archaeon]NIQ32819.1 DUF4129 domain-containing protein [Nitrososphaeria archaeon]
MIRRLIIHISIISFIILLFAPHIVALNVRHGPIPGGSLVLEKEKLSNLLGDLAFELTDLMDIKGVGDALRQIRDIKILLREERYFDVQIRLSSLKNDLLEITPEIMDRRPQALQLLAAIYSVQMEEIGEISLDNSSLIAFLNVLSEVAEDFGANKKVTTPPVGLGDMSSALSLLDEDILYILLEEEAYKGIFVEETATLNLRMRGIGELVRALLKFKESGVGLTLPLKMDTYSSDFFVSRIETEFDFAAPFQLGWDLSGLDMIFPFFAILIAAIVVSNPLRKAYLSKIRLPFRNPLRRRPIKEIPPEDPRKNIEYLYRKFVSLLSSRGFVKTPWQTHREFAASLDGLSEYPLIKEITEIYEHAVFSGRRVKESLAARCNEVVDSLIPLIHENES